MVAVAVCLKLEIMHPLSLLASAVFIAALPLLFLLILSNPYDLDSKVDANEGFWGPKTATVNWCEADYVYTRYVAELGNVLSSLTIAANGLYGIMRHYKQKSIERRFILAFCNFLIVGFGSCLFHGTLLREFQLADELPMLWGNGVFIFIVMSLRDEPGRKRSGTIAMLVLAEIISTIAVLKFDNDDQTIFLCCYGLGTIYLMWASYQLNNSLNFDRDVLLMEIAVLLYVGGFFVWVVDRLFCETPLGFAGLGIRSFYLHAFWHLGAGSGTFVGVIFWIWLRATHRNQKPVLRGKGILPFTYFIQVEDKKI